MIGFRLGLGTDTMELVVGAVGALFSKTRYYDEISTDATDLDDLHSWFLKVGAPVFDAPITHMFCLPQTTHHS